MKGEIGFDFRFDFDPNDHIDFRDLFIFADYFGAIDPERFSQFAKLLKIGNDGYPTGCIGRIPTDHPDFKLVWDMMMGKQLSQNPQARKPILPELGHRFTFSGAMFDTLDIVVADVPYEGVLQVPVSLNLYPTTVQVDNIPRVLELEQGSAQTFYIGDDFITDDSLNVEIINADLGPVLELVGADSIRVSSLVGGDYSFDILATDTADNSVKAPYLVHATFERVPPVLEVNLVRQGNFALVYVFDELSDSLLVRVGLADNLQEYKQASGDRAEYPTLAPYHPFWE